VLLVCDVEAAIAARSAAVNTLESAPSTMLSMAKASPSTLAGSYVAASMSPTLPPACKYLASACSSVMDVPGFDGGLPAVLFLSL